MHPFKFFVCAYCCCVILITIACVVLVGCNGSTTSKAPVKNEGNFHIVSEHARADFPTKPGFYEIDKWKYIYTIQNLGSRSEMRSGKISYEGHDVIGRKPGEILETTVGRFVWMGINRRYSTGWLNTLTYDRPVFDDSGEILPELKVSLGLSDADE